MNITYMEGKEDSVKKPYMVVFLHGKFVLAAQILQATEGNGGQDGIHNRRYESDGKRQISDGIYSG